MNVGSMNMILRRKCRVSNGNRVSPKKKRQLKLNVKVMLIIFLKNEDSTIRVRSKGNNCKLYYKCLLERLRNDGPRLYSEFMSYRFFTNKLVNMESAFTLDDEFKN